MDDILSALRSHLSNARAAGAISEPVSQGVACVPGEVIASAIAEIEHLRSVAGAVSRGPSFDQIREAPPFVLKVPDGS